MSVNGVGFYNQSINFNQTKNNHKTVNPSFGMALRQFDVVDEAILKNPDLTQTVHGLAKDCKRVANKFFGVKGLTDTYVTVDGEKIVAKVNVSKKGVGKINEAKPKIVEPFDSDSFTTTVEGRYNSQSGYNHFVKSLESATKKVKRAVNNQVAGFETHKQQIDDIKNGNFILKYPEPKTKKPNKPR